jgi:hypothetical protein
MASQSTDLTRFNRRMDQLVENVVSTNSLTPEFRKEYIRTTNLLRRVAEYDSDLACELFVSIAMFSYTLGAGVINKCRS